jgi:hypothetical protein
LWPASVLPDLLCELGLPLSWSFPRLSCQP